MLQRGSAILIQGGYSLSYRRVLFGKIDQSLPAVVRLQIRSQQPTDVLETLNTRHQQGQLSGFRRNQAERWLKRLHNALFTLDAGHFNKAKNRLLELCQPAVALVLQVPDHHLGKLGDVDVGKLDFSGVRLQTEDGLPIRPVEGRLYPALLRCPGIEGLSNTDTQKQAESLLLAMSGALEQQDAPKFSQAKHTLNRLFESNGISIDAQSPLVLHLQRADVFSNKTLKGLDLSNLALIPPDGRPLKIENTTLLHCNLKNTHLLHPEFTKAVLLGNQMDGLLLEKARFTNSLLLLNRMEGAGLERSTLTRSDMLLNEVVRSSLAGTTLEESDLSFNILRDSSLAHITRERSTARFNVVPHVYPGFNDNLNQANTALTSAIQQDTRNRLENIWFRLNRTLGTAPKTPQTPEQLEQYLFKKAASSDMVLPPRMQHNKMLRRLTNLLVSTRSIPKYVQDRHPYAELAGLLPVWNALIGRLPGVDVRQTPLGDAHFLPALSQRLRQQKQRYGGKDPFVDS